ncbi:DEAD/DEAH box helicase family protein [Pseudonocardia sp. CA-142604]|uniref:DEAD/DEAH box helicase family protein n=1 Tax=Pseudonocardia sp. CA-142604 TaxID=3240024 RepID=UPI003D8F1B44
MSELDLTPPTTVPSVMDVVREQTRRALEAYRADPGLIEEHAHSERRISQGGYGDRQIFELVQNAADEIRSDPGGEIAVVLTSNHLYCANQGSPVTPEGADTILRMSVSRKRGGQIGRFGVGVKSVLAISDTPEFFSTADGAPFAFGFDREWAAEEIRRVRPDATETPVLRMSRPIDPVRARDLDPTLDELLTWATTVVRLPLRHGSVDRLAVDLKAFPVEFGIFSPHVGTVTLEDRRGVLVRRQIFQRSRGNRRIMQEVKPDGTTLDHEWRVFTRMHRPSVDALRAAGELHDRPELDISWAVPERSTARGMFWAYFPTKFATTLRGILNAPWKTSEDRQAIFDGNAFNDELIKVAADLVVESLPGLSSSDDPASYIDYLPGRGREAPQFADERLTAAIWALAARCPSLVDQGGAFRAPSDIELHPENLPDDWLRIWASHPGRPAGWVHHSAERRERRARVSLILGRAGRTEASVVQWLEALVTDRSPEASAAAVRIVAAMTEARYSLAEHASRARVVLTESGELVAPARGEVYRRAAVDSLDDDLIYVDERVVAVFGASSALESLGIREADATGRFAAVVDKGFADYSDQQWNAFWSLSREAGSVAAIDALGSIDPGAREQIHVRTVAGGLKPAHDCLLPGPVVPADGSRDAGVTVDLDFHAEDGAILRSIGLSNGPVRDRNPRTDAWFEDYLTYAWEVHLGSLDDKDHRPQRTTMRVEGPNPPGPLRFLQTLTPEGRAAFLGALPDQADLGGVWKVQVGRQQGTRRAIASPLRWIATRFGHLRTSRGLRPVSMCVGSELEVHQDLLPVADVRSEVAAALRLPRTLEKVPERMWVSLLREAAASCDDEFPGRVYALVMDAVSEWPEGMSATRCRVGDAWSTEHADSEIAVTAVRAEYEVLVRERVPALLVPTSDVAERMIDSWGMLNPSTVIKKEVRFVALAEPVPVLDLFPHLRTGFRRQVEGWSLARCSELEEVTRTPNGMRTVQIQQVEHEQSVLVLRPEDDLALLTAVDVVLRLGLGPSGCRSIIERRDKQRENERIQQVREARSAEEKVLGLIGAKQLRAGLPAGLEENERARTGAPVSDTRVAELALKTHGAAILRHHSRDIATGNEEAPRTFAGGSVARRFVAELGLGEEFAGYAAVTPPEMEEVDGPAELPPLHDYQERVVSRVVDLLLQPQPGRAMLRLPTGAGKTRVAVDAVIRIASRGGLKGPILWIAQSDELCEQAVGTWKFVWSKAGPRAQLTINRFWGGNDAAPVQGTTQLVVATDAQLGNRLGNEEYAWLRSPALVVVDEAHRAIAPTYTSILEKLGLTSRRTDRPLIGLTATPYRGMNEIETKHLVERFGGRRLDEGLFAGEDPYAELQAIGVLAKVDHRELPGATIHLDTAQLTETTRFGVLPSSAEAALAADDDRNERILESIVALPEDWPILVFATSVNHAKLLTALLNDRGIGAASIDGSTPMPERRSKIEAYRSQERRVLTNYGVLAQGFDAPTTRAVVIARPTYSPNTYQQMIGRGLRGPRNGGSDTCLILDVHDNVANYGRELAFTEFEHLWRRP